MSDSYRNRRIDFDWVAPKSPPTRAAVTPPRRASIADHLRQYGHLESTRAASPNDQMLALLQLAVEVEHALLVQYLYASASVAGGSRGHQ